MITDQHTRLTRKVAPEDWIEGVIIGFEANRGAILLKHHTLPSIRIALESYTKLPVWHRWVAWFSWNCITPKHRSIILNGRRAVRDPAPTEDVQRSRRGKRKKAKRRRQTLGERLVGRIVHCRVVKDPTWKATEVLIQFGEGQLMIPRQVHWRPSSHSHEQHIAPTCIHGQLERVPKRNNACRPWHGMTQ
jgi:hypothetical protein